MHEYAKGKLLGPAIALIVVSLISILVLLIAATTSAWLLLSGTASEMRPPPGVSKEVQIIVRMTWEFVMVAVGLAIIVGAVSMIRVRGHAMAVTACIFALIPCVGPCFVLGIPFGIWGLVVLFDPHVRDAMQKHN